VKIEKEEGKMSNSIFNTDYEVIDEILLKHSPNSTKSIFVGEGLFKSQTKSLVEEIKAGRKRCM